LVWDGTKRIGVAMARYFGADFNGYTQHIGRMFFLQMIARISQPGCQADHMLVLEGPQGILKSSACRVLGGEWYSDHLPEISHDTRAASQHLRGKWLIEVAEMHAFTRAEATKLKSFITRTTEIYLARYGRSEVYEPRQCCFVGTTNEDQYLRDASGGRRFWPLKCGVTGEIDVVRLAEDRDQLFAEAKHCFEQGDNWWPDASFERELIVPEQAERYAADIWEDKIATYVSSRFEVTIPEIAFECLTIPPSQQTRAHEARIGAILKEMGWSPKRTNKRRFWIKA
jgi:putative DNA primase/helicase